MQPTESDPFDLAGTFREVYAPRRLVYTWRWETGPAADGSESLVTAPYRMRSNGSLAKCEALLAGSGADA